MTSAARRATRGVAQLACVLVAATVVLSGQSGAGAGEWRTWGGDLGNTRYAPLDQINAANFNSLEIAWRFKTDNLGPKREFNFESTPLVVKGVLYSTGGSRRAVFALDAATGEQRWVYSLDEGKRADSAPRKLSGHGVAYWTDGALERIFYVTIGYQLIALDAKTGQPVPSFGTKGIVDLKRDDDQAMDLVTGEIGLHATPVVSNGVVIIGAAHQGGNNPESKTHVKGYVRGFDARTGKRLWIFHTIPRPGEFGTDTWEGDAASYTGNAGVWTQVAVDEDLGLAYLPVELPTGDYYGGHRPGNGLFGESLVAVDVKTGKRKWHYQLVHHGVWDFDLACPPVLADITVQGRTIKAVAEASKQGFLYVFDRVTGEPVWPIEERPVPQSDVPGEKTSATQPVPTKPPAYDRQGVSIDDLIDFTPELRAEAVALVSKYRIGTRMFSPPSVSKPDGPFGTLVMGGQGGANWPGGSFDPDTHMFYVYSHTSLTSLGLTKPDPKASDMNYVRDTGNEETSGGSRGGLSIRGLPLVKPPYGRITAIDLDKGEIAWQIPHGETPDNIRNHPALKGLTIPRTGRLGLIGTLATKTLVIAGEAGFFTTPSGQRGAMLRAYDKSTGKEVGAVYMPAPQSGSPMTYMLGGQQYIVVAVSGGNYSGELLAFRLPK
ncbi:MAG: pyrroloquinoline quinone-dependent dehydrogenase [Acidobacteriota bacterium]